MLHICRTFAYPLAVRVCIEASDVNSKQLREIMGWAETHSAAGNAIRRTVPTTIEVEIV